MAKKSTASGPRSRAFAFSRQRPRSNVATFHLKSYQVPTPKERLIRQWAPAVQEDSPGITRLLKESGENKLDRCRMQASSIAPVMRDTVAGDPSFDFPQ
jgi:hypothetical protein